ncbi:MAG: EAL domain-containing protein [Marinobacter sp.]|uniref:sensor domain-containing protein n=1 Tax=Marinobacter sp. TaxID=50741 RepID=UPI00299E9951|nr:EAL domain-containing protein [Marinobacter sp.]MDX1757181.1 EAL domain-containing protein [Marinobacter sp.]
MPRKLPTVEAETLYDALMNAAADAIVVIDETGIIRHFSDSAQELFEYAADECIGQNIRKLMPEPYRSQHDKYLRNYRNSGQAQIIGIGRDVFGLKKSGRSFPMHLSVGEAWVQGQRLFVGICHDLTTYRTTLAERASLEKLQHALLDAAVDGIITINDRGLITSFNAAAEQLFQYSRDEVLGENVKILMPERYAQEHDDYIRNYLNTGQAGIIGIGRDVTGRRKDGSDFPMHLSVGESEQDGRKLFVGICHDLSEYKSVLVRLGRAERRYKDIVQSQKQLICRLDSQMRLTFANASFSDLLGIQQKELIGMPLSATLEDEQRSPRGTLEALFAEPPEQDAVNLKLAMKTRDRETLVDWSFRRLPDSEEYGRELQGFGIDVSEMEAALSQARFLRSHDQLTGLLNKRAFLKALRQLPETHDQFAMLHFDCERFASINQRYGYNVGDLVIIEMAQRIRNCLPNGGLSARVGGDEFLMALPVSAAKDVSSVAQQLLNSLQQPVQVQDHSIPLSGSIGVVLYPKDCDQSEELSELAEAATRRAKARNELIAFYNPHDHALMQQELELEQGLKSALLNDELDIYLQPKVRLDSGQVISYEALVRWPHPVNGFIAPAQFVPIAERSTLGQRLDRYVIRQVAALIADARGQGREVPPIAINITASHFASLDLVDFLTHTLNTHQLPTTAIELEITEGVVIEMSRAVSANLDRLLQLGIRISLDDFGTGYSSLSYLKNLTVDELKIDKSFIDELQSSKGTVLVSSIIAIATAFDIDVTAEGIERQDQHELLMQMGCNIGQGYFLGRPMPAREYLFDQLVQND